MDKSTLVSSLLKRNQDHTQLLLIPELAQQGVMSLLQGSSFFETGGIYYWPHRLGQKSLNLSKQSLLSLGLPTISIVHSKRLWVSGEMWWSTRVPSRIQKSRVQFVSWLLHYARLLRVPFQWIRNIQLWTVPQTFRVTYYFCQSLR